MRYEINKHFCCLYFSDDCCPKIDWYEYGEKKQGSFIIQDEKINGNCYYKHIGHPYIWNTGAWMCGDKWGIGSISLTGGIDKKGQCEGLYQASTVSKPDALILDNSLVWKSYHPGYIKIHDFRFICNDVSIIPKYSKSSNCVVFK